MGTLIGLSHVRHSHLVEILPTIVVALVMAPARYHLPVCGNGGQKKCCKIQEVIRFVAQVVSGRRKLSRSADVRAALGWLDTNFLSRFHTFTYSTKFTCIIRQCRFHFPFKQTVRHEFSLLSTGQDSPKPHVREGRN